MDYGDDGAGALADAAHAGGGAAGGGADLEAHMLDVKGMMVEWFNDYDSGEYLERITKLKEPGSDLRLLVRWFTSLGRCMRRAAGSFTHATEYVRLHDGPG